MALNLFRDEGIDVTCVSRCHETSTGVGFIVVEAESGQNSIVLDPGANERLTAADVFQSASACQSAAVLLTQLEIPVNAAESALKQARSAGATTILNPAPVRALSPAILALVDVLTPNESEARVLTGRSPDAPTDPIEIAHDLLRSGVKNVVMTLGEKGALLVNHSSENFFPAIKVRPADTTGAGDAFNAGLAVALAHGESIDSAITFATITGAMAVTKEGVIPSLPRVHEVVEFCDTLKISVPEWLSESTKPLTSAKS